MCLHRPSFMKEYVCTCVFAGTHQPARVCYCEFRRARCPHRTQAACVPGARLLSVFQVVPLSSVFLGGEHLSLSRKPWHGNCVSQLDGNPTQPLLPVLRHPVFATNPHLSVSCAVSWPFVRYQKCGLKSHHSQTRNKQLFLTLPKRKPPAQGTV